MERYLTTPEAAEFMRLSPRTLEGFRRKGGGPPFIRVGPSRNAKVVYPLVDLLAWLESRVCTGGDRQDVLAAVTLVESDGSKPGALWNWFRRGKTCEQEG